MKIDGRGRSAARQRGRPSSPEIDQALTEAALEEFTLRGYQAMTLEAIAARAGVSKVSLYRRWHSKLAMITEVLQFLSDVSPVVDHGSFEADVRALLSDYTDTRTLGSQGKILMRLLGEITANSELRALYRTYLLAPRLEQLRQLVERARARGEVPADVASDVVCGVIAGPLLLYYLSVFAEAEVNTPGDLVDQLTHTILHGVSAAR